MNLIAVEPIQKIFHVLRRNLSGYTKIHELKCLRYGVGANCGERGLFHYYVNMPGESTRNFMERSAQRNLLKTAVLNDEGGYADHCNDDQFISEECPMITLSELMRLHEVKQIDLLKVDVEGDELEVLKGIDEMSFEKIRQIAIEVHDIEGRLSKISHLLQASGFHKVSIHQQTGSISNDGLYQSFVPESLKLYLVYATKNQAS